MKHEDPTYLSIHELPTLDAESFVLRAYRSNAVALQTAAVIGIGYLVWSLGHLLFPPTIFDTVDFLDVGQGDAALITLSGSNGTEPPVRILIDGGRDGSVLDALSSVQGDAPFTYIDLVILSHQDTDHYGGLIRVLEQYAVGALISNGNVGSGEGWESFTKLVDAKHIPHHILDAGDAITYDGIALEILLPTKELRTKESINDASLVFTLTAPYQTGTTTVLFTGDAGFPAETALLEHNQSLNADVLKVGHHGSKHSSSAAFIHAVAPTISVISVGKNSYGHPAPEVLDTLERAGSSVYTTLEHGTVHLPLDPGTAPLPEAAERGFLASVFLGAPYTDSSTTVTTQEAQGKERAMTLVPVTTCSFAMPLETIVAPVRINEVAWMGDTDSATYEWIELLRTHEDPVDISGWQLINESGRVHAIFPQDTVLVEPFAIAARSATDAALSLRAENHFTGALRNTNEGIRLFDNECHLVDEVVVSSSWSAGDNATKRTMERLTKDVWVDSLLPGGTPRQHTSGTESNEPSTSDEDVHEALTPAPYLFAEFEQETDGLMQAVILAEQLPSASYDLKVSLQYDGTDISETMHPNEETWKSSLYYLPELFAGEMYDGTVNLRLREAYETFSGDATLLVRIREHGATSYEEYAHDVHITEVPRDTNEKEVTKSKTKIVTVIPPEPDTPTITATYPDSITAGEQFTALLTADHFDAETYDVKVSIEHEGILSRTLREDTWSSSQFYVPALFVGPTASDISVSLMVPTSTEALPETAAVLVRARKQGKSGFVYFQGTISITEPVTSTTTSTETEEETADSEEQIEEDDPEEPEENEDIEPAPETDPDESEEETADETTPEESTASCVDINTASLEELDTLIGIGPALAERIIAERDSERGPFTSLEGLERVSGIGPATVENIRAEGAVCAL